MHYHLKRTIEKLKAEKGYVHRLMKYVLRDFLRVEGFMPRSVSILLQVFSCGLIA
jgi:hypothetical protein